MRILLLALILAIAASSNCFAQVINRPWKKRVTRTIEIEPAINSKGLQLSGKQDTTLLGMLLTAVKKQELIAYSAVDATLTIETSFSKITEMTTNCGMDIDTTIDPNTHDTILKIKRPVPLIEEIVATLSILEDWEYDPHLGKMTVHIVGIGPASHFMNADGTQRSSQARFWLRYTDIKPIIDRYEQYHPNNTLAMHIWNDYFQSNEKKKRRSK